MPAVTNLQLSTACFADEDLYMMSCPLICFYAVEYHLPHRVARQFGQRQEWPVQLFSTSIELHKIDRRQQKKTVDFETLHRQYIEEWDQQADNLYENEEPHDNNIFRGYLSWYVGATRSRLKGQWTQADYADMESSDDEDTAYDLATRSSSQMEAAPIIDRAGNIMKLVDIERLSCAQVDDTTRSILTRIAARLRRGARRCGCLSSAAVDVQGPSTRVPDTSGVAGFGEQSSSRATVDTFEAVGGDDEEIEEDADEDEPTYDELGATQLHDTPSTQPSQPPRRNRRPPNPYTPGSRALGGKGKARRL